MTPSLVRRVIAALVVLLLSASAVTVATAASGFTDRGIVRTVNGSARTLTVRDTEGDPALRGRTITIQLRSSTRAERDGSRLRFGRCARVTASWSPASVMHAAGCSRRKSMPRLHRTPTVRP